jgi:hypothetical protein
MSYTPDKSKVNGSRGSQLQRLLSNLPALLTSAPVQAGDFSGVFPEWGRTADVQKHFGIKRGTLYNLHADGLIRGKVLRVRGQVKGVRLWDMQSIREFIHSQPDSIGEDAEDHKPLNVAHPTPSETTTKQAHNSPRALLVQ